MLEVKICPYIIKDCYKCIHSHIKLTGPEEYKVDGWKACEAKLVCELGVLNDTYIV